MEEEKGGRIGQRPYILKIITERNYIIITKVSHPLKH